MTKKIESEGDRNTTPLRKEWQVREINEETQHWLNEDSKYFLKQSLSTPCLNVLKHCEGPYIEDFQGRRYLDFHGNNVHHVGFSNPKVIEAITQQMKELSFCTRRYTNTTAIKLAKKLTELAPGNLNKVLFTPGGTSAMGMALKLARIVTGRFKTISMWDSFHGASLDAISIGGEHIFRSNIGPLLPGTEHVPPADPYRCMWGCEGTCNMKCADYIEYIMEREGDVAAVIAETTRSSSVIPPPDYWKKVREICDRHGVLLILDEIPNGLGRTGKMFTCQNYDIVPDILVIGKSLGGGIFPLAAMISRDDFDIAGEIALGHYTHEKNPVATAAALATIEYIEENNLVENAYTLGKYTLQRLGELKERFEIIGDVRGLGLLMGIELVKDKQTKEPANEEAEKIMYAALSKGLSFKTTMGNIITLTPPLTITKDQMDNACDILEQCFEEIS